MAFNCPPTSILIRIMSRSVDRAIGWSTKIEAGGVLVAPIPQVRLDRRNLGGVKDSGSGFEGVIHAMEEMSRPRKLAIRWRTSP